MIDAITVSVYPFPPGFDITRFVSFYSEFSRPDLTWDKTVGIENFSGYYFQVAGAESGENGNPRSVFFLFGDVAHHILLFARVPASTCALQKKRT